MRIESTKKRTYNVNATYHWKQSSISKLALRVLLYFPPRRERLRSHSFLFSSFPRRIPPVTRLLLVRVVFLQFDNSFLQFLRDRFYGPHRSAGRPLSTAGRRTRLCRRVPLEGLVFLREIALRVEGAQKSGGGKKRWRTFDYLISRTRLFLPLRDDVSPWMSNK